MQNTKDALPQRASALARSFILIALVGLTLAGCASVQRAPTPQVAEAERAQIVLIALNQQELEVDKPDVNGGGGLIGALIEVAAESYMDKNRQEAIAPIRDVMIDMNAEQTLIDALRAHLPAQLVRPDAEIKVLRDVQSLQEAQVAANGKNGLLVIARYAFEQDFRALYVHTGVAYGDIGWLRNKKGKPTPKYKSVKDASGKVVEVAYNAQFPLSTPDGSYTPNVARWMTNGGEPIRAAVNAGIVEVTDLIQRDLPQPLSYDAKGAKSKFQFYGYPGAMQRKAIAVERAGGRTLFADGIALIWTADHALK